MRRMLSVLAVSTLVVSTLVVSAVALRTDPIGAAQLQKACTVLTPAEIEAVVGIPIGAPDGAGSKYGCSFDVGDGIGSLGGGLVVTQYQTGPIAKTLWSAAKKSQEKVGKIYWDPVSGIATGFRKGKLFAVSVTITGSDDSEHQAQAVDLVDQGLQNL